ncbi:hypothetical protein Gogos_019263 [Gossypium gossypioides]|uniref:RNase H type-1 domain-containing protein n=1 Tax=Gossypium gossypioides TaxID=34282 RepID=A0A7J9BGY5_GOSGO|nr:hypothetical protein [Gossypium gossypioides]
MSCFLLPILFVKNFKWLLVDFGDRRKLDERFTLVFLELIVYSERGWRRSGARVTSSRVEGLEYVNDLIILNPNRWDRQLIYSTFSVEEINKIKNYRWPSYVADLNFNEWLNWLFLNSTSNTKEEISITIWAIWFAHNKLLHERKTQSTEEVITFIQGYGRDYKEMTGMLKHPKPRALIKWEPPPMDWLKVNADTGFFEANHHAVSGFLIRNDDGNLMGLRFKMHNLVRTVVLAEVMAVLDGIQFTKNMGFSRDVKNLARGFASCRFEFVTRERNTVMHAMASKGMKHSEDSFWVEDALFWVLELTNLDRRFHQPP